jgi:putative colanic acid biosynthesis UDP-glucose lipid carrier transferase
VVVRKQPAKAGMVDYRQHPLLSFAPLLDGLLVGIAGWAAYYIRWGDWSMRQDYLLVLVLGTALAVVLLPLTGAYQSWRGRVQWHDIGNALSGLLLVVLILALAGTLTKTTANFSRLWMAYWFLLSLTALFVFRWGVGKAQRWQLFGEATKRQVLIIGEGDLACQVAANIRMVMPSSMEILGFVATREGGAPDSRCAPLLGHLEQLEQVVSALGDVVDEIWIAASDLGPGQRKAMMQVLRKSFLIIRFVPDLSMLSLINHVPTEIAGMTVIDLNASPLDGPNGILKTTFDKVFSLLVLVLLAPLMCVLGLAIKLDSRGPVFFIQKRHGWDGRIIRVLKFRTMKHAGTPADDSRQAVRDDPRVTTVGRLLRRTSLDELPQFINVLRGEMSVVGPRPHPLSLNESYTGQIDAYMQRHRVKPGITGWAQIHGLRGETETLDKMQKRLEYDLYYIEHWSLWLDVTIILRTLIRGWSGESAY